MKEIGTISPERINNGAHFLYVINILHMRRQTPPPLRRKPSYPSDRSAFIDYVNTEILHYKQEVLGDDPRLPSRISCARYQGHRESQ